MARPNWEYVRIDVLMPEHPKFDGITPADKWLFVELLCYCGRHRTDGIVSADKWKTFGTPKARARLVERGLVDEVAFGAVSVHGYLEHQRSRAEIEALSEARRKAGSKGGSSGSKS